MRDTGHCFKKIIPEKRLFPYIGHILINDYLHIFFGEIEHDLERERRFLLTILNDFFNYDFFNNTYFYWIMEYGICICVDDEFIKNYNVMMKNKKIEYTRNGIIYSNYAENLDFIADTDRCIVEAFFINYKIHSMPVKNKVVTPNIFILKDAGIYG